MTTIREISPKTLKSWLDNGSAILIDVRDLEEYEDVRIPGSLLVPVEGCGPAMLPHNPDKKIVFHCHKGARGQKACAACIDAAPHREIYHLEGGIGAWIEEGLPVQRGVDPDRI
jgi:rhodanese-related sulfurtransferase